MNKLLGGLIGGAIGGLIGAAIWAGIAYGTGYEIGWIAIGVGALVGFGVLLVSKGSLGPVGGVLAVVISIAALLGGKYAAVELQLRHELEAAGIGDPSNVVIDDEELLISYVADQVVEEYQAEGKPVNWPRLTMEEPEEEADYPPDVWADAVTRWETMSDAERDEFRRGIERMVSDNLTQVLADARSQGFKASFGILDIVFFLLAIVTAYKLGAGGRRED
jgi:hypothetical protein